MWATSNQSVDFQKVVYTPVMNPHLTHLFYRTMVSKCSVETCSNSIPWEPVTNANSDSTPDLLYQKFLEVGPSNLRINEPLGWFLCTLKCDHTCGLLLFWGLAPSPRDADALIGLRCSLIHGLFFFSAPGDSNVQPWLRSSVLEG